MSLPHLEVDIVECRHLSLDHKPPRSSETAGVVLHGQRAHGVPLVILAFIAFSVRVLPADVQPAHGRAFHLLLKHPTETLGSDDCEGVGKNGHEVNDEVVDDEVKVVVEHHFPASTRRSVRVTAGSVPSKTRWGA